MADGTGWWGLFQRRFSRRGALRAGSASVAGAVLTGSAAQQAEGAATSPPIDPSRLATRDPHAAAGRWSLIQERLAAQQGGPPRLSVVPISRAKFLVGQRFDLRVEATNI